MTQERERLAATKRAALFRVEQRFNGRLAAKHYALETYKGGETETTRYEGFMDSWVAYLSAAGWKDPGA